MTILGIILAWYLFIVILTWPFAWYRTPTSLAPIERRISSLLWAAGWPVRVYQRFAR